MSQNSGPDNCFLKVYKIIKDRDQVIIFSETYENNLMNLITENKKQRISFTISEIEDIIICMVHSFHQISLFKIIHCNITPENLLLTKLNKVKITGFSLENDYDFSHYDYLAPELLNNEEEILIDYQKSDVFSLGLIIYQLITFEEITELNRKENNHLLLHKISQLDVPDWAKSLLENMLKKKPSRRYSFKDCINFK